MAWLAFTEAFEYPDEPDLNESVSRDLALDPFKIGMIHIQQRAFNCE